MVNDYSPTMEPQPSLAAALRRRDPAATRELVQHHTWAVRYAKKRGARLDAEDVVQEVFMALIERPPDALDRLPVRVVLSVKIRDRVARLMRERGRGPARQPGSSLAQSGPGLSSLARERRMASEVFQALERLESKEREVLGKRYGEGLRAVEIAKSEGLTGAAVRGAEFRALASLRRELGVAS